MNRRNLMKVAMATTALVVIPTTVLAKITTPTYYIHNEFKKYAQIDSNMVLKDFNMSWSKVDELVSSNYNCKYKRQVQGGVIHSLDVRNGISKYYIEGIEVVLKPSERTILVIK